EPPLTGKVTACGGRAPPVRQPDRSPVSKSPLATIVLPGMVTVSTTVVVCVVVGPAAVTVMVAGPAGVLADGLTVSVEPPPDEIGLALKLAVAPFGSPLALSATLTGWPDVTLVVTAKLAAPLFGTDRECGEALSEKSLA